MYLSKLELSMKSPCFRQAMDAQKLHRLLTGLYESSRQDVSLLYRKGFMDGGDLPIYLYASCPVKRERFLPGMYLEGERCIDEWVESMERGCLLRFDLLTMPCKKASFPGEKSRRRVLRLPRERIEWLAKKGEQSGFHLLQAQEAWEGKIRAFHPNREEKGLCGEKKGESWLYMDAYRYSGLLQVEEAERFHTCIAQGVGPGKAYGLGMLLLSRT